MAGRIKRIRVAYFRQLAADIARRALEWAELSSALEWRRTGIDGFCSELQGSLGGSFNGWHVASRQDYGSDSFTIGIRYRGNGVGVEVEKREIRLHRKAVLEALAAYGADLARMPCRHETRLRERAKVKPSLFEKPSFDVVLTAVAMKELYCPHCGAAVSKPSA